jgi:uncharacterized protein HemY
MPNKPTYHYHLGMAYIATNNWAGAREALQKSLALSPDFDGAADARRALASIK